SYRRSSGADAIGNRRRRVIQVLRFDEDVSEAEETLFEFREMNAARKILQLHRKIRVLHLSGKRVFKAALKSRRRENIQLAFGEKCRREKWKALDVVPMCVTDQQ